MSPSDYMQEYSPRQAWAAFAALVLGFAMIVLDTTIVNVAIPSIANSLGAGFDDILWVVNAYILVYAVLLITAGRLGDLYGWRRMFLTGLVIFTVASGLCGLAPSAGWLIAARVLQGVGGALLTPQTLAILTTLFPPYGRGTAFGIWGSVAGLAAITGPTLGGFIVTTWSWRGIFLVNLPIGVVAFIATLRLVPGVHPGRKHKLDIVGVLLASASLFSIVFAFIEGEHLGWGVPVFAAITLGAVLIVAFVVVERRQPEPLIPPVLFTDRCFATMNATLVAMAFGMLSIALLLPFYLQSALKMTALQAGLTIAPMSLVSVLIAPFAGRLSDRFGARLVTGGLVIYAAGAALLALFTSPAMPLFSIIGPLMLAGVGLGSVMAPSTTVAMRDIRPEMAGAASGVLNTTRQLGGTIGSAVVGAIFQARIANSGVPPGAGRNWIKTVPAAAFAEGLSAALTVTFCVLSAGALISLRASPKSRQEPRPDGRG